MKSTLELAVYLLLWSGFILWTVRKLWISPDDPEKARFCKGVKALSLFVTIGSAGAFTYCGGAARILVLGGSRVLGDHCFPHRVVGNVFRRSVVSCDRRSVIKSESRETD